MKTFTDAEKKREAIRRANLLMALDYCDPMPVKDADLLGHMRENYPHDDFSMKSLRKALKYLEGHGLALVRYGKNDSFWDDAASTWIAGISAHGTDYISGFGPALSGVYRAED
jgi:hypothetical protein